MSKFKAVSDRDEGCIGCAFGGGVYGKCSELEAENGFNDCCIDEVIYVEIKEEPKPALSPVDYTSAEVKNAIQSMEVAVAQLENGGDPITLPPARIALDALYKLNELFNLIS